MLRLLRFLGLLIVHTLVAVIGTAVLEHTGWRVFPSHSVVGVLWKEWIFSIMFATLIGFGMWRKWQSSTAKWTWVIPVLWFTGGVLSVAGSGDATGRIFGLHTESLTRADTRSFSLLPFPWFGPSSIQSAHISPRGCIRLALPRPIGQLT
jgi:hypothetical protein